MPIISTTMIITTTLLITATITTTVDFIKFLLQLTLHDYFKFLSATNDQVILQTTKGFWASINVCIRKGSNA